MAADGGCARCGAPSVHDTAETLRQERALAWALQQVADADDAKAAALALQERHAARARLLAAGVQTTAQPTARVDAAPSPATDEAIVPATKTMRAGPAPLDGRRMGAPPPPRPVLTPAEARARFERRLEIGGW
ncbi:MAG: hypothetical protein VKI39_07755, partial [Synechococcus sp.]|nr:hypothetical protein [Synechococcus sp.]